MEYVATCLFGLEGLLGEEIDALGYHRTETMDGRISFVGDECALARASVNLRFAERLAVKRVKIFDIKNNDKNFPEVTNFSAAQIRDTENKNVYTPPKLISIENCDTGIDFVLEDNDFFKETTGKWG